MSRKTYSDIVTDLIEKEHSIKKEKEREAKKNKENKDKDIGQLVNQQFENAKRIIGNRLTMKKSHSTYYGFEFNSQKERYRCYIHSNCNFGLASEFAITELTGQLGWSNYKIRLEELSDILINWMRTNLHKEGVL